MPSLMKKLTELARSPQASNAIAKAKEQAAKAKEQAAKPENRQRLEQLKNRVTKKR